MKNVTIASDISTDTRSRTTTWACYIRHQDKSIKVAGEFKEYYKDTSLAETYALINALIIAKNNVDGWEDSRVVIYNEIEHVLDPILTKTGKVALRDSTRAKNIKEIAIPILSDALEWERHKIKAHTKNWETLENPEKYEINNWCDKEARRLMRKIRKDKKYRQNACAN